jgi:hypothetical protein
VVCLCRRCGGAITEYEGRGQERRGRQPRPWRSHGLHYQVEAVSVPQRRTQQGRPPKAEAPQVEVRYRLRGHAEALVPAADAHGWTVLATTVGPAECTDTESLQAYQAQYITVEPGFRWIKNPAAISPVWLEKPERIAALAMLTVVGLLVYVVQPRHPKVTRRPSWPVLANDRTSRLRIGASGSCYPLCGRDGQPPWRSCKQTLSAALVR